MKIVGIAGITSALIALSSCSSNGPIQPTQLIKKAELNETHCYDITIETAETRVKQFLNKCYANSRFSSDSVKVGNIPRGKRISLSNGSTYDFSVELRENINNCKTQAIMYGIDSDWKEALTQSNYAVYAKPYSCP